MNFLELCQRLRQEVGAAGSGPANVTGQQGEYARLVGWIQQAWREIQLSRKQWRFAWAEASVPVTVDFREYSPPANLRCWDQHSLACNGDRLIEVVWHEFRKHYLQEGEAGRPTFVTRKPNGNLLLDARPRRDGEITFEYWRTPQELTESISIPRLPGEYHMVIVYRAMLFYALYENAPEVAQAAQMGEARIMNQMVQTELPGITVGGPLA